MPASLGSTALVAALALAACAGNGGDRPPSGADASIDAGPGSSDAGPLTCPTGQHVCGSGCIDDQENVPERGCRLGCGEACPQPAGTVADCDPEGSCTVDCMPPATMGPDGTCSCTPTTCEALGRQCGDVDDGCGATLACGACMSGGTCNDGICECSDDSAEANDLRADAHVGPSFTDEPNTDMVFDTWSVSRRGDEDWYRFSVSDDFDAGNPYIQVDLEAIPMGSNYDLGAWYECNTGGEATTCDTGTPDNTVGRGCIGDNLNILPELVELDTDCEDLLSTDDSGTLWVRVRPVEWNGSCEPYRLRIRVR